MPLYEYQCQSCGKKFEVIQKFSDEPLTIHEECGGHVEKLISAPAFHLKGTGWYATDYAKTKTAAEKSHEAADSKPKSEATASAGTEAKSASGAESTAGPSPAASSSAASSSSTDSKSSESKPAPAPTKTSDTK